MTKGGKETAISKRAVRFADGFRVLDSTTIALHSLSEIFICIAYFYRTHQAEQRILRHLIFFQVILPLFSKRFGWAKVISLEGFAFAYRTMVTVMKPDTFYLLIVVFVTGEKTVRQMQQISRISVILCSILFSVCYKCQEIMRFLRGVQGCWELITRSYPAHSLNHRSHRSLWGPMTIWFT